MAIDTQQKRMAVARQVFPSTIDRSWRATVAKVYPYTYQDPPAVVERMHDLYITNDWKAKLRTFPKRLLSMKRWR